MAYPSYLDCFNSLPIRSGRPKLCVDNAAGLYKWSLPSLRYVISIGPHQKLPIIVMIIFTVIGVNKAFFALCVSSVFP